MSLDLAYDDVDAAGQPLLAQARHLLGCYARYFANRPHLACDRLHFHELVHRFDALVRAASDVPTLRAALAAERDALHRELADIEAAHAMATAPAAQVGFLAARANQQFQLYDRHFAGWPRVTRRPLLVKRMVANLTAIAAEMRAVAEVHENADNTTNIGLVEKQAERARDEDVEIEKERAPLPRVEVIRLLGGHLNAELIAYRSKKQRGIDLETLAGVCDRVGEYAYQMLEITAETEDSVNMANLRLASRTLDTVEAEYEAQRARQLFLTVAQLVDSAPSLRTQLVCAEASDERRREALAKLDAVLEDPLVRQLVVDARAR